MGVGETLIPKGLWCLSSHLRGGSWSHLGKFPLLPALELVIFEFTIHSYKINTVKERISNKHTSTSLIFKFCTSFMILSAQGVKMSHYFFRCSTTGKLWENSHLNWLHFLSGCRFLHSLPLTPHLSWFSTFPMWCDDERNVKHNLVLLLQQVLPKEDRRIAVRMKGILNSEWKPSI